jgi:hypothetical protein
MYAKQDVYDVVKLGGQVSIEVLPEVNISEFMQLSAQYGYLVRYKRRNKITNFFASNRIEQMLNDFLTSEHGKPDLDGFDFMLNGSDVDVTYDDKQITVSIFDLLAWIYEIKKGS